MKFLILFIVLVSEIAFGQNAPLNFINSDIEKVSFADDIGNPVELYSFYGINKEKHLYHRTISQWNGLASFKQRKKFYVKVINQLIFQPDFSSLNFLKFVESSGSLNAEDISNLLSAMVTTGNLASFSLQSLSKLKWLKYSRGVQLDLRMLNKIKAGMRKVRYGSLKNFNTALDILEGATAGIDIADNSFQVLMIYTMQKAFDVDKGLQRIAILKNVNIKDKAYRQAINEVDKQIQNFDRSIWNKIVNAYRLNPNAFRDAGRSAIKLSLVLGQILSGLSLNPWIKSLLFTADQFILINDHWDHLKTATIAATFYKALKNTSESEQKTDCILYSEYLFTTHYNAAMNNTYTDILSHISSSYKEYVSYLRRNEERFKERILEYYLKQGDASIGNQPWSNDLTPKLVATKTQNNAILYDWVCDVNGDGLLDKINLKFNITGQLIIHTKLGGDSLLLNQTIDFSKNFLHIEDLPNKAFSDKWIIYEGENSESLTFTFLFIKSAPQNSRAILIGDFISYFGSADDPGFEDFTFIPFNANINKFQKEKMGTVGGKYNESHSNIDPKGFVKIIEQLHWYSFLSHAEVPVIKRAFAWDWTQMKPKEITTTIYRDYLKQLLQTLKEYQHYAQQNNLRDDIQYIGEDIQEVEKILTHQKDK